jgi:hypothetical protein
VSRVTITRHESGEEHFVIGWDAPLATFFWQEMGTGEHEGEAFKFKGYMPSELPTWQIFMNSVPKEFKNTFSEQIMRKLLEEHQRDPELSGGPRGVVNATIWPGWIVEVRAGSGFARNGLVFETKVEAERYGADLFSRWMAAKEYRAVQTPEQPTHKITENNKLVLING